MSADSSGARAIRATDDDRTAVITALDSALASGQLDQFEHYERVRTATAARNVDELRPLFADLQGVRVRLHGDAGPIPAESFTRGVTTQWSPPTGPGRRPWGVLAGALVVAALMTGAFLAFSASEDPDPVGREATAADRPARDGQGEGRVFDNPAPLSPEGLERIFSSAGRASGSELATSLVVHPEHAVLSWTDPEHPSRTLRQIYRGGWSGWADSPSTREGSFRLADLDAAVIAPVVAGAAESLGIAGETDAFLNVAADDAGRPSYTVHVRNDVHQSGFLVVDHAGEPVRIMPPG
ncbi:DUF1707 domain-containing protein [Dietzia sp. SYD-A1]|uniref:DUF1707 SHOCT-like domain-containing protein n=2 Tax=unclassified Dietzia TaxID=2617939 RepID=UPI001891DD0D|nr:DUF1707 domain-containing protein [Dietzia sp. SYD-A1]